MKDQNNKKPEELLAAWKKAIVDQHEGHKATHVKKEFTFSTSEVRQLIKAYTIETLAKQLIEDKLNNDVLIRVGIVPSSDTKISYDLSVGRFVVWTPK